MEDNYSRLKEIISKTLLQSVMDSNLISFEKWINSSEDYAEQETNMAILEEAKERIENSQARLEKYKDFNYKSLVEMHQNFKCFVTDVPFDDYIQKYTLKQNFTNDSDSQTSDELAFKLAKALTNPNVINLIAENFLNNK